MGNGSGFDAIDAQLELARLRREAPGEYLVRTLGNATRDRLIATLGAGVPAEALALSARWWQLENYLRLLVYIELKALAGPGWQDALGQTANERRQRAAAIGYMASADDDWLPAHADVSPLFDLVDQYWEQCSAGIGMPKEVWAGRVAEIKPIRHRIAHCRRPHPDDVLRVEQLLRDLERGANRALRSYTDWFEPVALPNDPVALDWVEERHPVARRLVQHGHRNKGIHFTLMATGRPWAHVGDAITGSPGFFWVVHVVIRDGHLDADSYLDEYHVQRRLAEIGHIIHWSTHGIAVTLPAVGDPGTISDAIGDLLEGTFTASLPGHADQLRHPWRRASEDLDPRVDAGGLLSILSGLNAEDPMSIFAAS